MPKSTKKQTGKADKKPVKSSATSKKKDASPSTQPTHFVGIGASAGGLEAIEAFFSSMPYTSDYGFIVIQHLSPDYKSMMVELLSKRTRMPVHRAENGMQVEKNNIYLITPKKNLTIFHGKLILSDPDHSRGINLPIDIFLHSLAEDQGEKAIGIILSGTGSDGMRGVRAIKEAGGTVLVQDEESAKFDGMPKSAISTGLVDFIMPPIEMPSQILSLTKYPLRSQQEVPQAIITDEDALTKIFSLLRGQTKVDFTYYKPSTVIRRIERRMTINQIHDFKDYTKFVESYPAELQYLYRDLLIGVTNFYRDPFAFDLMRDKWIPSLLKAKEGKEIRIWVTGCSTGEEAYTLAILFCECMELLDKHFDIKIFATDIDSDAILKAGNGVYPESIIADLPPELMKKYFNKKEEQFQIIRKIREMVVFAQHNLVKDPPFTNIDLVSCRNLLIYLQPVLQRKALEMFNFSLNAHGILFLGSSETIGEMVDYFDTLDPKWKIYRCKGKKIKEQKQDLITPAFNLNDRYAFTPRPNTRHPITKIYEEEKVLDRLVNSIVGEYVPKAIIVDLNLEILHILGDLSKFLKFPSGKMQNDVSKMIIKELAVPLTTGIKKVFKKSEGIKLYNIRLNLDEGVQLVHINIKHLQQKRNHDPLVAVFIEEAEIKEDRRKLDLDVSSYDIEQETQQRITDLEQELQFSRENLQATIEELETSNEELQATNEELLASNEELQSTNEELQSVNEELYTVNSEYQRKIMELTELNNDIDNLFTSTNIGVLFLDENLYIRKFTSTMSQIYKIIDNDEGRPISHISHKLIGDDPMAEVVKVLDSNKPIVKEVKNDEDKWFVMKVLPYHIGPQKYSGAVLTFFDITSTKQAQEDLELSQERNRLTQESASIGNWDWNIQSNSLHWSDTIPSMFGLTKENTPKNFDEFLECVHKEDRDFVKKMIDASLKLDKKYHLEHRVCWPNGTIKWVEEHGKVFRNEQGNPVRMMGIVRDITDRVHAMRNLLESEENFRLVFDKMHNGFLLNKVITDKKGRVLDIEVVNANQAFKKMTNSDTNKIEGQSLTNLFPEFGTKKFDWFGEFGKIALNGDSKTFQQYFDSQDKWFSISTYSPKSGFFVTIFEDISGKKKNQPKKT